MFLTDLELVFLAEYDNCDEPDVEDHILVTLEQDEVVSCSPNQAYHQLEDVVD